MDNIPQFTLVSVIGMTLALALLFVKWHTDKAAKNQKEQDDEDKRIDESNTSDELLRRFDELRDKKSPNGN